MGWMFDLAERRGQCFPLTRALAPPYSSRGRYALSGFLSLCTFATAQLLINTTEQTDTIIGFRNRYRDDLDSNDVAVVPKRTNFNDSSFDMASDSSSSNADDEANRISELYANLSEDFDGKHRIKFKGDELKIKGRSGKQRGKLMDAPYFQPMKDETYSPTSPLINVNAAAATNQPMSESDMTSFDFLDDYDIKYD